QARTLPLLSGIKSQRNSRHLAAVFVLCSAQTSLGGKGRKSFPLTCPRSAVPFRHGETPFVNLLGEYYGQT
ncbi:hypothetical protein, partial [Thalassobius sp. I31.1]|uniref:hypothetical protein n=1 Tax=Thalassobius sp. I31.1 TaxID=2109912 RepID=UPI001E4AC53A